MDVAVAVFAKAPVPGFAKTRLIPLLGEAGAAALHERLVERALVTACEAALGPVTLWGAPDGNHPFFGRAASRWTSIALASQPGGDLGARMLAAFAAATPASALVLIGTDCPVLTPDDLCDAADALRQGADTVIAPAEDGGYGLIGARRPIPNLFVGIPWGTDQVAALTRGRANAAGIRLEELRTVWDVDTPDDCRRLHEGPLGFLVGPRKAGAQGSMLPVGNT